MSVFRMFAGWAQIISTDNEQDPENIPPLWNQIPVKNNLALKIHNTSLMEETYCALSEKMRISLILCETT